MNRNSEGFGMHLEDIHRLLRCFFSFPGFHSFVTTAAATEIRVEVSFLPKQVLQCTAIQFFLQKLGFNVRGLVGQWERQGGLRGYPQSCKWLLVWQRASGLFLVLCSLECTILKFVYK